MKIRKYHNYNFSGQDPIVRQLHVLKGNEVRNSELAKASGVAAGTLANWWSRRTKRPQFATVMAVARTIGYDLKFTKKKD